MTQETTTTTEYKEFINDERAWMAKHREEYKEMKKTLPHQAFDILRQIALKIAQCNADSPAEKSHYTMGQCRQVMAGWDKELGLIDKFEKAEKRITAFDLAEAQRQE